MTGANLSASHGAQFREADTIIRAIRRLRYHMNMA